KQAVVFDGVDDLDIIRTMHADEVAGEIGIGELFRTASLPELLLDASILLPLLELLWQLGAFVLTYCNSPFVPHWDTVPPPQLPAHAPVALLAEPFEVGVLVGI